MLANQSREANKMECPVLVKCDDGSYWLHDFSGRLSYLDGEDFSRLVDSEAKGSYFEAGQ